MGQSITRPGRTPGHSDPYKDSSVHSCRSVAPENEEDVLEHVVVDENAIDGPRAAVQAASDISSRGGTVSFAGLSLGSHDSGAAAALQSASKASGKMEERIKQPDSELKPAGLRHYGPLSVSAYLRRMRGGVDKHLTIPAAIDIILAWLGAFSSILIIASLRQWATPSSHFDFLVASFGASAVLLFGSPEGKLSQPRSLICGHVLSATVGCVVRLIFKRVIWLSTALGMAAALTIMQLTRTVHPPGGATALIAASAPNPLPRGAGFSIVLVVLIDACSMLIVALLINNIRRSKRYPTFWF